MRSRLVQLSTRLIVLSAVAAGCARNPQPAAPAPQPAPMAAPVAAAVAATPAPAPIAVAAAGAVDVSGDWAFSLDIQGQAITGALTLTRSDGAYSGQIAPDGMASAPVRTVAITGTRVTITIDAPEGEAVVECTLGADGRTMAGTLSYNGQSGNFTATKR